jgi:hypothetical protein
METVLSKKPSDMTLVEYFKTLDVFDKRFLINELSDAKSYNDETIRQYIPYFITVVVCTILSLLISVTTFSLIFLGGLTLVMTYYLVKTVKTSLQFKFVINHLIKNM